jgi:hypothetical protein
MKFFLLVIGGLLFLIGSVLWLMSLYTNDEKKNKKL